MSFQMIDEKIDINWFSLVPDNDVAPETGVFINLDGINNLQQQSSFRFRQVNGTLVGQVYSSPTVNLDKYIATIRVYKSVDVLAAGIDWSKLGGEDADDVHEKLLELKSEAEVETNEDGTYEITLQPGTYDVLIDKPGYLDQINIEVRVELGLTTDIGLADLLAGDINKDGVINILDTSLLLNVFGIDNTDASYDKKYDFNEDDTVNILDKSWMLANYGETRKIIKEEIE